MLVDLKPTYPQKEGPISMIPVKATIIKVEQIHDPVMGNGIMFIGDLPNQIEV